MDVSNAVNFSGAVQIISVLSCLNSLSDFLVKENKLRNGDLQTDIPAAVLNVLDRYLEDPKPGYSNAINVTKLNKLANHLIRSNLCVSNKGEKIVNPHGKNSNSVYGHKYIYLPKNNIAVVEGNGEFLNKFPVIFSNGTDSFQKLYHELQSETVEAKRSSLQPVNDSQLKTTKFLATPFKNVHLQNPSKLLRTKRSPGNKLQSKLGEKKKSSLQPVDKSKSKPTIPLTPSKNAPRQNALSMFSKIKNMGKKFQIGKAKKSSLVSIPSSKFKKVNSPVFRFKSIPCSSRRTKRSPGSVPGCLDRTALKEKKMKDLKSAAKVASCIGVSSKESAEIVLRDFLFLEGDKKTEMDFVKDLCKGQRPKIPSWAEEYKIDLPEVFNELRFQESFQGVTEVNSDIQVYNSLYNKDHAFRYVTLEDYIYTSFYIDEDYVNIKENTVLGRGMRRALYRLSIRQSDDSRNEYPTILYRGERRPKNVDEEFKKGKIFSFGKFASATANRNVALRFAGTSVATLAQLVFEITFKEPFVRAKIENLKLNPHEEETILLPNSKFRIEEVNSVTKGGVKTVTVKMSYQHESKLQEIRNVMKELKKLQN